MDVSFTGFKINLYCKKYMIFNYGEANIGSNFMSIQITYFLQHCPEAALVSARVLAAEGAPAIRSASGVERRPSVPRPPLCKRGSGSLLSQAQAQTPPQSK